MERVILYTSPLSIALILWSTTLTDIHKEVSARLALSETMRASLSITPGIGVWIICVTLIVSPSIILYQRAQRADEALVISPIVPPFRPFLFAAFSLFVLTLVAPSLFQRFLG